MASGENSRYKNSFFASMDSNNCGIFVAAFVSVRLFGRWEVKNKMEKNGVLEFIPLF
jgi:hypothetical protein